MQLDKSPVKSCSHIRTVWTTNYDTLIEDAFRDAQKKPDVKISQENLALSLPRRDVTVIKMHGDVSQPHDAVITKDDYETYSNRRGLFTEMLQGDLVSKTFLFLGFSFTDPNIDYILSRIRTLLGQNQREHFCVMRRPKKPKGRGKPLADYDYESRRLDLRIADLKRYAITAIEIDEYGEITDILKGLNQRGHRKDVFVAGSAHDFQPLGKARLEGLCRKIGRELIKRDYNLVSGFGLGIGSVLIVGALEELYANDKGRQEGRTLLRPFPQTPPASMTEAQFHTKYRKDILAQSGSVIFISGNKPDASGSGHQLAKGVIEEFEIAKEMGKVLVPIGMTGHAAEQVWKEVMNDVNGFFPKGGVKKHLDVLGNSSSTDAQIVDAVFAILSHTSAV